MTTDLTTQIHQYLTTAPSSLFAQQKVEMLAHWEGDTNLLWRVAVGHQQAVIKLFLDAGQARSRRQFDGHQLFASRGLAPVPLWADRYPHGLSRQLIVYHWCDGEVITPDDPDQFVAWAEAIGTLHTSPTDEVRRFSPHPINLDFYWRIEQGSRAQLEKWLLPSGLALTSLFQELARTAEQLVQSSLPLWANASPTPVHGDLSREHTLVERGRVQLLDWEMFGLGDPALDVARLLQRESQTLDTVQTESWLDRYLSIADQSELAERIDTFQKLLSFHNVIFLLMGLQQHTTGQLDDELRSALPYINASIKAALESAMKSLQTALVSNVDQLVDDFFAWLVEVKAAAY